MSSAGRDSSFRQGFGGRLSARRHKRRRRALIALCIFIILLLCALVWGIRQNSVRISHVEIVNGDQSLAVIATATMQGNYFGIIPRDSIFFFPEDSIRANILSAHPELAAISISRNWTTRLSITAQNRIPIALWCPSTDSTSSQQAISSAESCYLFDANGFIFATTSPIQPVNSFVVFSALGNENSPIGSKLPNSEELPAAFNFARQLSSFGASVSSVVLRGDEVDDYVASSTRVTYVLGDEQNAFTALSSASGDFNLSDGSIEYIDLRFDGKIYVKKND
jgi:cell division septal protein FtsQ